MGSFTYERLISPVLSRRENGQAKIALGTLFPLVDSPRDLSIGVIGYASSGTISTGRTYTALCNMLTELGYRGDMLMYDPVGKNSTYKVGNFEVITRASAFKYRNAKAFPKRNGKHRTQIYDDVWTKGMAGTVKKEMLDYDVIETLNKCPEGQVKFAYRIRNRKNKRKVLQVKYGMKNHRDFKGALGGGIVQNNSTVVVLLNSSMSLGYHVSVVNDIFKDVPFENRVKKVGRLSYDPNYSIVRNNPYSRISVKYFDEPIPEGVNSGYVYDQAFYHGMERRMFFNCGKYETRQQEISRCGCEVCNQIQYLSSHIKSYSGANVREVILRYMSHMSTDRCLRIPGVLSTNVVSLLNSAAHLNSEVPETRNVILSKYPQLSEDAYHRIENMMIRCGKLVKLGKCEDVLTKYNFPRVRRYGDEVRYYDVSGTYYIIMRNGRYIRYTSSGTIAPLKATVATYSRPGNQGGEEYIRKLLNRNSSLFGYVYPDYYNVPASGVGMLTVFEPSSLYVAKIKYKDSDIQVDSEGDYILCKQ
eukprot:CAMPEP_0201583388 /NCGR_PEP_ID=MMETSP0190_2-20130828/97929_1 /ASSEMBLY_ACC=CAM_ASM_000263 /TAXON_ID=37353 /ORGANISM="Rosalina sp." /LENGTH=529 /DNA_ID=CAMNT_0048025185 /DNA_START=354 /DNA_END=1943 /DNA_ORIENTATION=+